MAGKRRLKRFYDISLVVMVFSITLFGLLMLYSASSYTAERDNLGEMFYLKRQALFAGFGFLVMLFTSRFIDYHIFAKLNLVIYAIAAVAVIVTSLIGVASHGSNRWIVIFGVRFQPSELMKPAIIILFATLLTHKGRKLDGFVPMLKAAAWALVPAAIIAYTNLSTAMIVAGIAAFMLFVAVKSYKYHLMLLGGGIAAYLGAYPLSLLLQKMKVLHGYQITRILAWKDPSSYEDETFQTLQGLYAIGSGGIFGRGLGESIQKFIMPESQNDMIFTIICEEFGIFGGIAIILIFGLILYRMWIVIKNARDRYGALLGIGIMAQVGVQVVLNVLVVTNQIPSTGVILPFISFGGTAIIIMLAEIGVFLKQGDKSVLK